MLKLQLSLLVVLCTGCQGENNMKKGINVGGRVIHGDKVEGETITKDEDGTVTVIQGQKGKTTTIEREHRTVNVAEGGVYVDGDYVVGRKKASKTVVNGVELDPVKDAEKIAEIKRTVEAALGRHR